MRGSSNPMQDEISETLSRQNFDRIAKVMRRTAGIELPLAKLPLVQSRLLRRLRALRLPDYTTYCDVIESDEADAERDKMLSALTTNVTGFFRELHHFVALKQHRLPELADRLRAGARVRVWSAGCSSGEEPYSLALMFLEAIPDIGRRDFKILATDIDQAVLSIATEGAYPEASLKNVSEAQRAAYFQPVEFDPGRFRVTDALRELVVFRRLNLIESWPLTRAFDVIMCRNVVIYFDNDTKAEIWSRIVQKLQPDGWLLTGHSERLNGPAAAKMELVTTTTYRPATKSGALKRSA